MKKHKYTILGFILGIGVAIATIASSASVFFPYQGGTGTGSAPSAGQVLIGTSGGVYSPANLTAGTNITISTSSGAITINSTASGGAVSTSSPITAFNIPYWATTSGGLNGTSTLFYASSTGNVGIGTTGPGYTLDVVGTGNFSVGVRTPALSNLTSNGFLKTGGGVGTLSVDTNTYLNAANNLSELTSTSTARSNLGLTDTATLASSTWFKVANNLSEGTPATMRTNLGLGTIATLNSPLPVANGGTATTTAPTDAQYLGANASTPTWKSFVAGTNITIATSSTSTTISASAGGTPGGSDTQVQYNNAGSFGGDSNLTYTSSTKQLLVNAASSSVSIGNSFLPKTLSYSYTGATSSITIPSGVTSITITAVGATAALNNVGASGYSASTTATYAVTPGTTYYFFVGGNEGKNGGCTTNGSPCAGDMTWFGTQSSFSQASAVLVAGGAGQGGGNTGGTGGNAGTGTPPNGVAGTGGSDTGAGGGGTQTAGGAAGSPSPNGTPSAGTAGRGGSWTGTSNGRDGGGGGGGYWGGGAGGGSSAGSGAGGGGGSSFFLSSLTSTSSALSTNTASTNGSLTITYNTTPTIPTGSDWKLGVGGHIITGGASATVSSCGTSPSVTGNDTAGVITTGSGTVLACTLNFAVAYAAPPVCIGEPNTTSTQPDIQSVSASAVTFGFSSTLTSGKLYYHCLGY